MKKITKMLVLAFALVLSLSIGAGSTAEAAKVTVKKVTSVNALTGSKTIYLAKGKKATLKTTVTVTPNKAANKKVTYKSSNKKVATVTAKGVITAKKAGTAKITVTSKKNTKKKATVTVKVVKGKVTSIKLNQTSGTLTVGDTVALKATVKVSSGGKKNVVWSSSDTKVATVKSGKVTAVAPGTATITVKAADGTGKKATYKVTVNAKTIAVTGITLDKTSLALKTDESQTLNATVVPADATDKTVTWTTSDAKVATVSNGVVKAVAPGNATITATAGGKTATCTVTVIPTYTTTITPADQKEVMVEVAFSDVNKVQADVDKIADFSADKEVVINLNGKDYTAKVENGHVTIGGKLIAESEQAKNATSVTIKTAIKADKIASVVAFTPASVSSVKVNDAVTFTGITANTFKIGATTYNYTISGQNIIIVGDTSAKTALAGLEDVVTITETVK